MDSKQPRPSEQTVMKVAPVNSPSLDLPNLQSDQAETNQESYGAADTLVNFDAQNRVNDQTLVFS